MTRRIRSNPWFADEKCEANPHDKFRAKNILNGCSTGKLMHWAVLADAISLKKEKKKIKILTVITCWKEDDFKYYIFQLDRKGAWSRRLTQQTSIVLLGVPSSFQFSLMSWLNYQESRVWRTGANDIKNCRGRVANRVNDRIFRMTGGPDPWP